MTSTPVVLAAWLVATAACGADNLNGVPHVPTQKVPPVEGDSFRTRRPLDVDTKAPPTKTVEFEFRDGYGPLFIRLAPHAGGEALRNFPSRDWNCAATAQIFPAAEFTAVVWRNCRLDDPSGNVSGDFDVVLNLGHPDAKGINEMSLWLDNRLNIGIQVLRYVMRIKRDSLPADPNDTYTLFAYDEYVRNPFAKYAPGRIELGNAAVAQTYIPEGPWGTAERFLYRNRLKITPTVSVHTPDWAFQVHTTDPGNSDPGWMLVGANPNDAGTVSVEFGYEARVEGGVYPGNGVTGLTQVGPALRTVKLPAKRPLVTAWWEAVDSYKAYLLDETDLLPAKALTDSAYPAKWSHDCLYSAWNVGGVGAPIDVASVITRARDLIAYYRDDSGSALSFCPLLWGLFTYAPFEMPEGGEELLAALQAVAQQENVEIYPGSYFLPSVVDYARARAASDPVLSSVIYQGNGQPAFNSLGPTIANAREDNLDLQNAVREAIEYGYSKGMRWVYHDSPFGEWYWDRKVGGAHRLLHEGVRDMVQLMADTLTRLGGGIVTIEAGRLGLSAMQAGHSSLATPMIIDSTPVEFADAIFHGRNVTGFSGDVTNQPIPLLYANVPGNTDHITRLAFDGAVHGRAVIDPLPEWRKVQDPSAQLYGLAVKRSYQLRRRVDALSTGTMLPAPPSDIGTVTVHSRGYSEDASHNHVLHPNTGARVIPELPVAMYEDLETDGRLVLVVGNPYAAAKEVTFDIGAARYSQLGRRFTARSEEGQTLDLKADGSLTLSVEPLDFKVVYLTQAPWGRSGQIPVRR